MYFKKIFFIFSRVVLMLDTKLCLCLMYYGYYVCLKICAENAN